MLEKWEIIMVLRYEVQKFSTKNIFNFHISGKLLNKKCDGCFIHMVLITTTTETKLRPKHVEAKH
jgi:hypothetical protein